jgi:hypothetical protein
MKYIAYIYLWLMLASCDTAVNVTPIELTPISEEDTFDYNFVATPDFERLVPREQRYSSTVELYYNPFERIDSNTPMTLKFESSKFALFIVSQDTLYPGDQIKIPVSEFISKRLYGQFYTIEKTAISATFSTTVRTKVKTKSINYTLL